jgi:four helix bundle protein
MDFIEKVYRVTETFPNKEVYGLVSQLRRAAASIALNIAEGSGSGTDAEFKRFIAIALRSTYEVMCGIEIAHRLNYCSEIEKEELLSHSDDLSAMLGAFQKKLKADS